MFRNILLGLGVTGKHGARMDSLAERMIPGGIINACAAQQVVDRHVD